MGTLRARIFSTTGLLLGLQVLGTAHGLVSWWQIHASCERQLALGADRTEILELGSAAREAYVHQAHTFIDGNAGHLGHLGQVTLAVDDQLARVEELDLPESANVAAVRQSLGDSNLWFAREVEPRARAGTLDREAAMALHAEAERRAARTEGAIGQVLASVAAAQDAEVAAIAHHTGLAWTAVGLLTLGGIGLGLVVAARLARAVLGPVEALRGAARAFASGDPARAPVDGDEEMAELGRSFNAMVRQVHAAEERRLAAERLAALGEMSGAVAHELQSPLAVILGHPALANPELRAVREEAEHASRVVRGLLGFARPGEEDAREVDLLQAAREAAGRMAMAGDVDVRVEGEGARILASPSAVRQILDNLLLNAVQASGPEGLVEVRVGPDGVEVADRGPGIPASIRERLYEPFVTGRHAGTGLGLAISQRIARASGGALVHRQREGGGTVARWEVGHA